MRLIDADKWASELRAIINAENADGNYKDYAMHLISELDIQPTAFDVEKVVEQLGEAKFPITDLKQGVKINGIQQTDDAVLYNKAVKIVKAGGVNEDR